MLIGNLSFLSLFILSWYFHLNIFSLTEGVGVRLELLLVAFVINFVNFVLRFLSRKPLVLYDSVIFFVLFYLYFFLRHGVDLAQVEHLKALTIGTSGGTLLFYFLGLSLSLNDQKNFQMSVLSYQYFKTQATMVGFLCLWSIFWVLKIFINFSSNLEAEKLIITNLDGWYQRPGNFLIINAIILAISYINILLASRQHSTKFSKFISLINGLLVFFYLILSVILSQLFGSNNAFVTISGITMGTLIFSFFVLKYDYLHPIQGRAKKYMQILNWRNIKFLLYYGLGCGLIFCSVAILICSYVGIDIWQMRFMNFGEGGVPTSITSRLLILQKDFLPQFDYAPILGDPRVRHILRLERIHSFIGGVVTKLGLLGISLFGMFLVTSLRNIFKKDLFQFDWQRFSTIYLKKLNLFFLFIWLFFIGGLGEVISWIPLWFTMGFCLPVISFKWKILAVDFRNATECSYN
jgi:hypothetical protein